MASGKRADGRSAVDARRALLERLIDHAPLYPPASLPLDDALADHRAARAGPHGWLVRRFVCPASTLEALPDEPIALSLVLDREPSRADPRVEAMELPPGAPAEARGEETYLELPPDADLAPLARAGLYAKVRCGGASVPSVEELAGLVRGSREHGVPFKATAGLHHAVARDGAHGFLNLLAAAIFGDEEEALSERDADAFRLDDESFSWRDRSAGPARIAEARRETFVAFGSCSFEEPRDELVGLGFL